MILPYLIAFICIYIFLSIAILNHTIITLHKFLYRHFNNTINISDYFEINLQQKIVKIHVSYVYIYYVYKIKNVLGTKKTESCTTTI